MNRWKKKRLLKKNGIKIGFSGKYIKDLKVAKTYNGVDVKITGYGKPIKLKNAKYGMIIDNSKASVVIEDFFLISGKR